MIIEYHENGLFRVKAVPNREMKYFEIVIQKRFLKFFWITIDKSLFLKEGFWGESEKKPVLSITTFNGNEIEAWRTGTLDIIIRKRMIEHMYGVLSKINRQKNFGK